MDHPHASAVLTVDLEAIATNYRRLCDRLGGVECAAVVKADAYGLGVETVAPVLLRSGCRTFFSATLDEAIILRRLLPKVRIYVLNGLLPRAAAEYHAYDLHPVLNTPEQVDEWSRYAMAAGGEPLPAGLHLDTGMSRLGVEPGQVAGIGAGWRRHPGIDLTLILSHLVLAEDPSEPINGDQLDLFQTMRQLLPLAPASLANSSGIFLGPDFHLDLARPGIALYGGNPTPGSPNPMRGVVRLEAEIIQVRDVDTPQTVGYGATHSVSGPARIATVPVGYADGYRRSLSNAGIAAIDGTQVPVVGRVSMDMITLDVTALPPDRTMPGTVVELIGETVTLDELAARAGTIGYELLTGLGRRFRVTYSRGPNTR